jgi:hypothetical protein
VSSIIDRLAAQDASLAMERGITVTPVDAGVSAPA